LPDGDSSVILLQTARGRPDDLSDILAAGATDYLAKPFGLELFDVRLTIAEQQVAVIAERKRAEAARDEALARFRALVEGATESIVLVDQAGIVTYASPNSEQLSGVSPQERLGKYFDAKLGWSHEEREAFWAESPNEYSETAVAA
jgi:PAS domain-containing protein